MVTGVNAELEYDKTTGRIIYFNKTDRTFSSMKPDGSDRTVISSYGKNSVPFTVDHKSRILYYISDNKTIVSFNMTNSTDVSVVLDSYGPLGSSVFDLDVDPERG